MLPIINKKYYVIRQLQAIAINLQLIILIRYHKINKSSNKLFLKLLKSPS